MSKDSVSESGVSSATPSDSTVRGDVTLNPPPPDSNSLANESSVDVRKGGEGDPPVDENKEAAEIKKPSSPDAKKESDGTNPGTLKSLSFTLSEEEKKQKRQEKFGLDASSKKPQNSPDEKIKARAERFGIPLKSDTPSKSSVTPSLEEAKKLARVERFGASSLSPPSRLSSKRDLSTEELDKRKKRAEKFGVPLRAEDEFEEKKRQRAERFSSLNTPSATNSS